MWIKREQQTISFVTFIITLTLQHDQQDIIAQIFLFLL